MWCRPEAPAAAPRHLERVTTRSLKKTARNGVSARFLSCQDVREASCPGFDRGCLASVPGVAEPEGGPRRKGWTFLKRSPGAGEFDARQNLPRLARDSPRLVAYVHRLQRGGAEARPTYADGALFRVSEVRARPRISARLADLRASSPSLREDRRRFFR